MFIQYHDIVKPIYLFAILKMIISKNFYGLPDIVSNMSVYSILEWYIKRRYVNPIQCLDYQHIIPSTQTDQLLQKILHSDASIFKLAPFLNINQILQVYRKQHMTFPVYVYSEEENDFIREDCKRIDGVPIQYIHGDLKSAIAKCDNNFTYIFSDIELLHQAATILLGSYSHILIAQEYRYNYNGAHFKYDLEEEAIHHPFIRIGVNRATDPTYMARFINELIMGRK